MTIIANFVCGWLNYQKSITFSTDPPFSFDPEKDEYQPNSSLYSKYIIYRDAMEPLYYGFVW